ncbi:phosphotransferase [Stagnimonas aquatica]|uniref:Phosphotransferase n=1 Tax=Stagnimonas aquatica TaxID=2689987 RepID=A0A3N0V1I1_9GAMM|nr:phosphotransferase [Stagnimonas aquatica]ROH86414.1 phosphotransferase [Stagnimonas aquatica]
MKKIDLHIHTVATFSDSPFYFSMEVFKRYVAEAGLDAVAVTNHDVFDAKQCREIQKALAPVVVFPGIEINLEGCHLLLYCDPTDIDDFNTKCAAVTKKIRKHGDEVTVTELKTIFGNLDHYLLIPHSDKSPPISADTLLNLDPFVSAGEVDSAKKFVRAIKDDTKLTPVLFSDLRMKDGLEHFPSRATFVDCGDISLAALKACIKDKNKVALSESDGNLLWPIFTNGQQISTGLNVIVGPRSSGKTHTLDEIQKAIGNCKYIRQFELVQQDEADYEKKFNKDVERRRGLVVEGHLAGLRRVLDDVLRIDPPANDAEVGKYVSTLLTSATEVQRQDNFSSCALFRETPFTLRDNKGLEQLIASVQHLIRNIDFANIIEKHVDRTSLRRLACELIELHQVTARDIALKSYVNTIVKDVKQLLSTRSSASSVADVDLFDIALDQRRLARFAEIVGFLKKEAVIYEKPVQGFRVEARRTTYKNASDLRKRSSTAVSFVEAYGEYGDPVRYLQKLKAMELNPADLYKLFVQINYRILNKDGVPVSGGERSEYRLIQEIADAKTFDALLIDEPESSFDNLFLKGEVNEILKALSETMPVVVVTHNNTVGASIQADYLLFTHKEVKDGEVIYRVYSGHPTDKMLRAPDGTEVRNHDVMMNSLEAGADAYRLRRESYEAVKN